VKWGNVLILKTKEIWAFLAQSGSIEKKPLAVVLTERQTATSGLVARKALYLAL